MAEAECGLNSHSATCYLAVEITGSNVNLVARLSNPPQHRECTRVGNGGLKRIRKRSKLHAWKSVVIYIYII